MNQAGVLVVGGALGLLLVLLVVTLVLPKWSVRMKLNVLDPVRTATRAPPAL